MPHCCLVRHGHQFAGLTQFTRVLEKVGTRLCDWMLDFALHFNRLRRSLGFGCRLLLGNFERQFGCSQKFGLTGVHFADAIVCVFRG